MPIVFPADTLRVLTVLRDAGYPAYAVGGCVRDSLLGLTPADYDVTTAAKPEDILRVFAEQGIRTLPTGLKHGTVSVLIDGNVTEVTTYRIDGTYSDSRHPDFVSFTSRIEDDLARRDFTVNAMACDAEGEIIDLYGGREDLQKGIIRAVGDPKTRFEEDALRILRALRFSTRFGFVMEKKTLAAMRECAEGLRRVSAERIASEWQKILTAPHAAQGIATLTECGILAVLFPALCPTPNWRVLDSLPPCYEARFAFLLSALEEADAKAVLSSLKPSADCYSRTLSVYRGLREPSFPENGAEARRFLAKYGEEALAIARIRLCRGEDAAALISLLEKETASHPCLGLKDLALTGSDLIRAGIPAGKAVGDALQALLDHVIEFPADNRTDRLLFLATKPAETRRIRSVVFDIGNVLAAFRWRGLMRDLGFDDATTEEVANATVRNPLWNEYDRSAVSDAEIIEACVAQNPAYEREIRTFFSHIDGICETYPYAVDWVRSLKARGYRVYLLSNFGKTSFEKATAHLPFRAYTDGEIISYRVGSVKPEPKIFEALEKTYGVNPAEAVFFDDVEKNVAGAAACGFHSHLFVSTEDAEAFLLDCERKPTNSR